MKLYRYIFVLAIALTGYSLAVYPGKNSVKPTIEHIFVDAGDVLFTTSKLQSFKALGLPVLAPYMYYNGPSTHRLKTRLFEVLDQVTNTTGNTAGICDEMGNPMPQIMVSWLCGTQSNKSLLTTILRMIRANPTWFANDAEKIAIAQMCIMIFTPDIFAQTRVLFPETVTMLSLLKQQGYKLHLLSNWDKESIKILQTQYPNVFGLFDTLFISGEMGYAKPQPEFFQKALIGFDPPTCILLDDQHENVAAAQSAGMHAILVPKKQGYTGISPDLDPVITQITRLMA